MLSRMTNLVLVVAVIVLMIALVQQSQQARHVSREALAARAALDNAPVAASLVSDLDFVAGDLPMDALAALDGGSDDPLAILDSSLQSAVEANPRRNGGVRGPAGAGLPPDGVDRPRTRGGNDEQQADKDSERAGSTRHDHYCRRRR